METILIARDRKTGKDVVLCGREVPYPVQADKYRAFTTDIHEEFSTVELAYVTACKKPLKLITASESANRIATAKAQAEAEAKTKAENSATALKSAEAKTKSKK